MQTTYALILEVWTVERVKKKHITMVRKTRSEKEENEKNTNWCDKNKTFRR